MITPANYKQVKRLHSALAPTIQRYVEHFPKLITADLPFEVAVAYLFQRVERAHRKALYCGIVKTHAANSELTDKIIQREYLTRESFDRLFLTIFKAPIPDPIKKLLTDAEEIRDIAMHGRETDDPALRKAIKDVLEYLEQFNAHMKATAGFEPCGDLRGFKGRLENLDAETTKWILKGLGFSIR